MKAIFRHELRCYFTTPMGYVFLIMYTLLAGIVYVFVNIGQEMSASMNLLLSGMQLPFMLIAPILTMRLLIVGVMGGVIGRQHNIAAAGFGDYGLFFLLNGE